MAHKHKGSLVIDHDLHTSQPGTEEEANLSLNLTKMDTQIIEGLERKGEACTGLYPWVQLSSNGGGALCTYEGLPQQKPLFKGLPKQKCPSFTGLLEAYRLIVIHRLPPGSLNT